MIEVTCSLCGAELFWDKWHERYEDIYGTLQCDDGKWHQHD